MDTKLAKKSFIKVYTETFGNVSLSCKMNNIARSTYYLWLEKDEDFKQQIKTVEPKERFLDFVESKLVEKIKEGDGQSIRFALERKGKTRDYAYRQELTGVEGLPNSVTVKILKQNGDRK
jgi:hypothetical protein